MNTDLKRCPFCGGEAEFKQKIHHDVEYDYTTESPIVVGFDVYESTGCPKCNIWFDSWDCNEPEFVTIELWNRRAES